MQAVYHIINNTSGKKEIIIGLDSSVCDVDMFLSHRIQNGFVKISQSEKQGMR